MLAEGQASHWALNWLYMGERQKFQAQQNRWSPACGLQTSCRPRGRLPRGLQRAIKKSTLNTSLLKFLIKGWCLYGKSTRIVPLKKPKPKHPHKVVTTTIAQATSSNPPNTTVWEETQSAWIASCLPRPQKDIIYYHLERISPSSCASMEY